VSNIEGVPEGWELVRIGVVHHGEWRLMDDGSIRQWLTIGPSTGWAVVLRKIEKPKQYRAFANKAEYAPHRDRWIKSRMAESDGVYFTYQAASYDDWGVVFGGSKETYQVVFNRYVFDNLDGTTEPFGVEVQ
jgi:hypothetical protein